VSVIPGIDRINVANVARGTKSPPVGSKWWLPLRRLNSQQRAAAAAAASSGATAAGGAACNEDATGQAWEQVDQTWRNFWERIVREGAARPSGLVAKRGPLQIEYSWESCGG
jgi:hypothetical protein